MMKFIIVVLVAQSALVVGAHARATASGCDTGTSMETAAAACEINAVTLIHEVATSGGRYSYLIRMQCLSDADEALCNNPRTCVQPPGSIRYDVFRSDGDGPFVKVGEVCLTSGQKAQLTVITQEMVAHEFARLDWPASPLIIQPPNGRTLVNLATNFLTTNTQPTSQHVTLLGQDVEIEATPTSWVWHYGDGAGDTTSSPGAAYPDLQITHTYLTAHVTVHPSVDTVYHGRYRINGGAWQDINQTRSITGAAVDLAVLEAQPVLVGP